MPFTGINPPEEINVIDKLNESNVLILIKDKIKKIIIVKDIYITIILKACLITSFEFKDKKFVSDFFKLSSNISINNNIENKKYRPPIH